MYNIKEIEEKDVREIYRKDIYTQTRGIYKNMKYFIAPRSKKCKFILLYVYDNNKKINISTVDNKIYITDDIKEKRFIEIHYISDFYKNVIFYFIDEITEDYIRLKRLKNTKKTREKYNLDSSFFEKRNEYIRKKKEDEEYYRKKLEHDAYFHSDFF